MHEYAMASELVQSVLEAATKHQAVKVHKVIVEIGDLALLDEEQLRFNFEILANDTLLKDSALEVKKISAEVSCSHCGYAGPIHQRDDYLYHAQLPTLACPKCEQRVQVTRGQDVIIQSIDLEVAE